MKCKYCGNQNDRKTRVCRYCGETLKKIYSKNIDKPNKLTRLISTILIMTLFIGGILFLKKENLLPFFDNNIFNETSKFQKLKSVIKLFLENIGKKVHIK